MRRAFSSQSSPAPSTYSVVSAFFANLPVAVFLICVRLRKSAAKLGSFCAVFALSPLFSINHSPNLRTPHPPPPLNPIPYPLTTPASHGIPTHSPNHIEPLTHKIKT